MVGLAAEARNILNLLEAILMKQEEEVLKIFFRHMVNMEQVLAIKKQ